MGPAVNDILFMYGAFIVVFFAVIFLISRGRSKKETEMYGQIAMTRNGRVDKGNLFRAPRLHIPLERCEVSVYSVPGGRNSPPYTYVTARLSTSQYYKLSVYKENFLGRFAKKFGLRDIETGNPEFDKEYIVNSDNEMAARNFLSSDVQMKLIEISPLNPSLTVKNMNFRLAAPRRFKTEAELTRFIDVGVLFVNKLHELG